MGILGGEPEGVLRRFGKGLRGFGWRAPGDVPGGLREGSEGALWGFGGRAPGDAGRV